jgi:hypothetical protein
MRTELGGAPLLLLLDDEPVLPLLDEEEPVLPLLDDEVVLPLLDDGAPPAPPLLAPVLLLLEDDELVPWDDGPPEHPEAARATGRRRVRTG